MLTESTISEISWRNREMAEFNCASAMAYLLDVSKDVRLPQQICTYCFYFHQRKVSGRAFITWKCQMCSKEQTHNNTSIPVVCNACATEHVLCIECGGDLHLRSNRETKNGT